MDMDIQSDLPIHDQPLRSEAETPRGDFDEPAPVRRRRALDEEVEKVQDETGEMVRGAFVKFLETYSPRSCRADDRFDDEFDPQQATAPPSTPTSEAWKVNNFYFAQLEEIERFGLTTLFVDFENLQDFSVEGEVGVLATAVATQYYRYSTKNGLS